METPALKVRAHSNPLFSSSPLFPDPSWTQLDGRERYIGVAVCWGGVRPRPGPLLPPLEGGGRRPRNGPRVVLPPVRKPPVSRSCSACCRRALACREGCGHRGGAGRAQMHGSDAPACPADVRHVRARPSDRRARCLRAAASSLCVGCRCDVQCGAMRVDALGDVPPVQPRRLLGLLAGGARQRDDSKGRSERRVN